MGSNTLRVNSSGVVQSSLPAKEELVVFSKALIAKDSSNSKSAGGILRKFE